jgi:hypothetical protein
MVGICLKWEESHIPKRQPNNGNEEIKAYKIGL